MSVTDNVQRSKETAADEYFLVLDKVYPDFTRPEVCGPHYQKLRNDCKAELHEFNAFTYLYNCKYIRFVQFYDAEDFPQVKTCVTIDDSFHTQ